VICIILYAKSPDSADIGQALLKGCEPAILATRWIVINHTPRIVLGLSAISNADDPNANFQEE
jgi:hypothetical protein